MRVVALLAVALVALTGCRSSRRERPKRDYTSINRSSWEFLKETNRKGRALRRANLKQTLAFGKRAPANRRIRKESRRFAGEAFFGGTWDNARSMWAGLKFHLRTERKVFGRSVRFGFLDSGE